MYAMMHGTTVVIYVDKLSVTTRLHGFWVTTLYIIAVFEVLKDFWRKRISLELQRENARQMISRIERAKKGIDRVNFQRLKLRYARWD